MDQESRLKKTRKSIFQNVIALACLFVCVPIALGVEMQPSNVNDDSDYDERVLKGFVTHGAPITMRQSNSPLSPYEINLVMLKKWNEGRINSSARTHRDAMESKALAVPFEKTRDNPLDPNKFDLVECIDDLIAFGTLETPKKLVHTLEHLEYVLEKSELRSDKKSELKDIVAKILVFRPTPKKTEANRDVCDKFLSAYNKLLEFFDDVYAARQRANVNTKDDDNTLDYFGKQTGAADKVIRVKKCKSYVTIYSTKEDLEKVKKNYMLIKSMFPNHAFIERNYSIMDQEFAEMIKAAPDPAQGGKREIKAKGKAAKEKFSAILNSTSISERLDRENCNKHDNDDNGNEETRIIDTPHFKNEHLVNVYFSRHGAVPKVRFYTAKDLFPPLSVVGEDEGDAGVQTPLQRLFAGIDF
jgi:hypothetical protein